ncbi:MAG: hypothetical protein ACREU5_12990, partial [Burkholderiales bacterium]
MKEVIAPDRQHPLRAERLERVRRCAAPGVGESRAQRKTRELSPIGREHGLPRRVGATQEDQPQAYDQGRDGAERGSGGERRKYRQRIDREACCEQSQNEPRGGVESAIARGRQQQAAGSQDHG